MIILYITPEIHDIVKYTLFQSMNWSCRICGLAYTLSRFEFFLGCY